MLLFPVIAGGSGARFDTLRMMWKQQIPELRRLGVIVYLLSFDASIKEATYFESSSTISFPGTDCLTPCILQATVGAPGVIKKLNLRGLDAPKVLRTNLSTFWNWSTLLRFINSPGVRSDEKIISGIQFVSHIQVEMHGKLGPDAFLWVKKS